MAVQIIDLNIPQIYNVGIILIKWLVTVTWQKIIHWIIFYQRWVFPAQVGYFMHRKGMVFAYDFSVYPIYLVVNKYITKVYIPNRAEKSKKKLPKKHNLFRKNGGLLCKKSGKNCLLLL